MANSFSTLGVLANLKRPHAAEVLTRTGPLLRDLGFRIAAPGAVASLLEADTVAEEGDLPGACDLLVAMGGDGTMLRAFSLLGERDLPVMGLNLGSLGFLSSMPEEDLEAGFRALARGEVTVSSRTRIAVDLHRNGEVAESFLALNDVVFGWGANSRMVRLELSINDEHVTDYACDGLIVATPTGSTAHSLSAQGPIVHPDAAAIVLSVICPHTLSQRPLVVPDDRVIRITISRATKELILAVDGQEEDVMREGDRLTVRRHPVPARLVHIPGYSYFHLLRQKLGWRGSYV